MIRVLEILSCLDGGGVERLLYDYCSRLSQKIHFDFVVSSDFIGILEKPLIDLGCNVFHVTPIRNSIISHIKDMNNILENGSYDIVHDHSGYKSFINLYSAKKHGVKVRIAHSHLAYIPETRKNNGLRKLITPITKYYSTNLFACGKDAGQWMWGNSEFYIMNNAVNTRAFQFNTTQRVELREKYRLKDKLVIGNVARFTFQKNHEFLIKIFNEIKKIKENAVLVLVGRGEEEGNIKDLVATYNLQDSVIFMGVRNDVSNLYNAMDVFVLPTRYEGLGMVLIEAQANGLKCFTSEGVVPKDVKVTNNVQFIGLRKDANYWADLICEVDPKRDLTAFEQIRCAGYDIDIEMDNLYNKYLSILNFDARPSKRL